MLKQEQQYYKNLWNNKSLWCCWLSALPTLKMQTNKGHKTFSQPLCHSFYLVASGLLCLLVAVKTLHKTWFKKMFFCLFFLFVNTLVNVLFLVCVYEFFSLLYFFHVFIVVNVKHPTACVYICLCLF